MRSNSGCDRERPRTTLVEMEEVRTLIEGLPTRKATVRDEKARGGRIAAVYPIFYSRELLRAFDVLPMEVWGPPGTDTTLGDAHLQAYTCSIARGGLAFLLSGGLDDTDLVLVPHACDSLQGLGSVLSDFVDAGRPVLTQYLPRGPLGPSIDFLAAELARLYERLAEITGRRPDDATLRIAIEREERADAALAELLAARRRFDVDDRTFYRLVRAREYLPAEDFSGRVKDALAVAHGERKGVGVVLSGIVPEPSEILDAISGAGAVVVGDDLACSGRRSYPAGSSPDPFRRMAQRLMGAAPDSTRGSDVDERVRHLTELATRSGARAVLFHVVKFCEPELFYLPQLRAALDQAGLRSIVVEADVTEALPAQAVTRVEALLESVP